MEKEKQNIHAVEPGQLEGDKCNRDGCTGIIAERAPDNCSCHINPPCHACLKDRHYCPTCGWEAED